MWYFSHGSQEESNVWYGMRNCRVTVRLVCIGGLSLHEVESTTVSYKRVEDRR